jgi:hypothetical protein
MTFNNVNVFRSVLSTLNTSGVNSTSDKIKRGGAFSPTTFEAVAIMRSEFDNQWENSYIIKYEALMQTRLNRLKQELNNAYKALLEISGGMHIREDADATSANKALLTPYGTTMPGGSNQAFNGLKYYSNSGAFELADSENGTTVDGIPSYLENGTLYYYDDGGAKHVTQNNAKYEMRRLYVTGPALQIVNDVNITMRTEEIAPKKPTPNFSGLTNLLGTPPFIGQQKLDEYSAEVKTGGFWTTVNYLYNFSPREMKYNYVTAYSTTTEEAGTRQINGRQATLYNNEILDARDTGPGTVTGSGQPYTDMNDTVDNNLSKTNRPPMGARVKWSPSEGSYITERNTFTGTYNHIDDRFIIRRETGNDAAFYEYLTKNNKANKDVKIDFDTGGNLAGKFVEYGDEEMKNASMASRLKWEFQHDGNGAADLDQDGDIDSDDDHKVKAAFLNHYIVDVRNIELNSSEKSYGTIKAVNLTNNPLERLLRSKGVDGSAEYIHNDKDGDGIIDDTPEEKLLLPGSGKISKSFKGDFIGSLHTIDSFNGQEISSNNGSIVFNKPVTLGEYEGFERAKMMSRGIANDYFDEINSLSKTRDKAVELAAKLQSEVNASGMVDTDWHYSQYRDSDNNPLNGVYNDRIMFKTIKDVRYDGGVITIQYDPSKVDGTPVLDSNNNTIAIINPTNYKNPVVAFRKTFNLSSDEIRSGDYSGTLTNDPMFIDTPNYTYKDAKIKISTSTLSENVDLIVNGKVVPPESPGVYNLKGYLQEGENVISAQMKFSGTGDHFFKLEDEGSNNAEVKSWIESKLSTDRTKNGDASFPKFNSNPDYGYTSSWQSKLMVKKVDINFKRNSGSFTFTTGGIGNVSELTAQQYYTINMLGTPAEKDELKNWFLKEESENGVMSLGSNRTATKVKDVNPLLRVLIDALNNPEYRDIFYLGMLNSDIGKNLQLKATISAPTGGTIEGVIDVRYNPKDHKFTLVQSKYDAFGGV